MSRVYRSAQGTLVDMEKLRLANEDTIAVGNMRVNARGDQLGPGGRVVKTRNQVMKEYYELQTPNNARVSKPAHRGRNRPAQPTEVESFNDIGLDEGFENAELSAAESSTQPQQETRKNKKGAIE